MTRFDQWCEPIRTTSVGSHTIGVLVSLNDAVGVGAIAADLPSLYAKSASLSRIAARLGKPQVSEFLRQKFPQKPGARSGDLGEILAGAYLEEDYGYVVGPSRLIHRDHQDWAMRGDDVLGARLDSGTRVLIVKGEAKSRAQARASVVAEARQSLQREDGLPSAHSLTQFAERLLHTVDEELGDAILQALLTEGVRPESVTHLMFLFAGNDPSNHVVADLAGYSGEILQRAVILRVQGHQEFIRAAFEQAIANGA